MIQSMAGHQHPANLSMQSLSLIQDQYFTFSNFIFIYIGLIALEKHCLQLRHLYLYERGACMIFYSGAFFVGWCTVASFRSIIYGKKHTKKPARCDIM